MAPTRTLIVVGLCASLVVACSDDTAAPDAEIETPDTLGAPEPDSGLGHADTAGAPDTSSECPPAPDCSAPGAYCQGDVRVVCSLDDAGCLVPLLTDCAASGQACGPAAGGEATCGPPPCESECQSVGPIGCLQGAVLTCEAGRDGCLRTQVVPCEASEACVDDGGLARCETRSGCPGEACGPSGATRCAGDSVQACVESADRGCPPRWTDDEDCAASGEVCAHRGEDATCAAPGGECPPEAGPCAALGEGATFCQGALLRVCGFDDAGCIGVLTSIDCALSNTSCVESDGGAACGTPPPPADIEVVGDWSFRLIADFDSPNPSGQGPFTYFEQNPTVDRGAAEPTVYFRATSQPPITPPQSSAARATFRWSPSAGVQALAAIGEPIPGGQGGFTDFDPLVVNPPHADGGLWTLIGNGPTQQRGLYAFDQGTLTVVADRFTTAPSLAATFNGISGGLVRGGQVVFGASATGGVFGLYRWHGGATSPVIGSDTAMPAGDGLVTELTLDDFDGARILAQIYGFPSPGAPFTGGQRVLARVDASTGALDIIAERSTPMPDVDDDFFIIVGGRFDGDAVYFHGRATPEVELGPFGSRVHKGIYRWEAGQIQTVVNTEHTMPGSVETFSKDFANGLSSQYMACAGGKLLFRGVGTTGDQHTQIGLYLYQPGAALERVLDLSDALQGKGLKDLLMSPQGFSEAGFALAVRFVDDDWALYWVSPAE